MLVLRRAIPLLQTARQTAEGARKAVRVATGGERSGLLLPEALKSLYVSQARAEL